MPTLSEIGGFIDPLADGARNAAQEIQRMEERVNSLSRTTRSVAEQQNTLMQMLTQSMSGMQNQLGTLIQTMQSFNSTTSQGRQNIERTSVDINQMFEVYKKMGIEVENLDLNLKTLTFTEREYNKVVRLGEEYNTQRISAYEQLSRKYSAMKILINNMTQAERESTAEGRNLVAQAREIYQQMNMLQQQTGKYQLQVGDYSKAMTGLNIATQQVIREMPVLAQSAQMFVMAISNNIPILLDNIKAVKAAEIAAKALKLELIEQAEAARLAGNELEYETKMAEANAIKVTSAAKGLLKSIMSWQTLIVLLLSVLPRVISKIQEKRKAVEDQNKELREALSLEKLWAEAMKDAYYAVTDNVTELEVLNKIATDVNRSWDDRIKAADIMREKWEDELGYLSAEQIALQDTKGAVDGLTDSLIKQATARAYLDEIVELTKKKYELEVQNEKKRAEQAKLGTKEELEAALEREQFLADMSQSMTMMPGDQGVNIRRQEVRGAAKPLEQWEGLEEEINENLEMMGDIDKVIQKLVDSIDLEGLVVQNSGKKGKKVKDVLANLGDYYYDYLESIYNLNEDEYEREYQLLDLQYKRQIKAAEDRLAKERETGQLTAEQEAYQLGIIKNLREAHGKALIKLTEEQEQKMRDTKFEEEVKVLKDEKIILDNQTKEREINSTREKRQLIQNEIDYWEEYLKILTRNGKLTVEEYDKIMSQIAKLTQQKEEEVPDTLLGWLGFATNTNFTKKQEKNLKKMYSTAIQYMKEWMDVRMEMAQVAVDAAEKETEAARKVLEYEMEARANGYASSVDLARKEYEEKMEIQRKALAEQEKMQRLQDQINTATQISSLVTATAELWASMASTGPLAVALAVAATAAMWTSFIAAKAQAASLAKKKTYGEGTVELLEGGSHASGHDIDMGTDKNGNQRRAEGGEFFAIINKRNSAKYRKVIPDVIKSFNDGSFAEKYQRANAVMASYAVGMMGGTDVSNLEKDVAAIRKQGDTTRYLDGQGNMIVRYKNVTRKILS